MRAVWCVFVCLLMLNASNLKELEDENKRLQAEIKQIELTKTLQALQSKRQAQEERVQIEEGGGTKTWFFASLGGGISNLGGELGVAKMLSVSKAKILGIQSTRILVPEDFKIPFDLQISPTLNAKFGGITMWNRYFGLQYYLGLDVISYEAKNASQTVYKGSSWLKANTSFSGVMIDTTLNADAVLNVYVSENFGVGFLLGLGLGLDVNENNRGEIDLQTNLGTSSSYGFTSFRELAFNMRANVGMRLFFLNHYAFDFGCSIPFLANQGDNGISLKNNVNFTINFSYGRF